MKKLKYLLVLCLFAIISTGCVKFNANMDIKKDKSMDFTIIYAFDKSIMGEMASLKEEDFAEAKKEGYDVEKYTEGNYEGFKISRKIKNIDEISSENDVLFNLSGMMEEQDSKYMFKVVKGEDKNTYYAKFVFDSNDSGLNDDNDNTNEGGQALPDENDSLLSIPSEDDKDDIDLTTSSSNLDLSGMMGSLDLSFNVNLPYGAISSNATTKENDNKKLTWKLGTTGKQTMEFAFELKNNEKADSNIWLFVGIGAGVLLLIIIVIIIAVASSKKKKVAPAPVMNNPVENNPIANNPVDNSTVENNSSENVNKE